MKHRITKLTFSLILSALVTMYSPFMLSQKAATNSDAQLRSCKLIGTKTLANNQKIPVFELIVDKPGSKSITAKLAPKPNSNVTNCKEFQEYIMKHPQLSSWSEFHSQQLTGCHCKNCTDSDGNKYRGTCSCWFACF